MLLVCFTLIVWFLLAVQIVSDSSDTGLSSPISQA